MTLADIEKDMAENIQYEIARKFILESGKELRELGIYLYVKPEVIDVEEIITETEKKTIRTIDLSYKGIDTTEHDRRIKAAALQPIKDLLNSNTAEIYFRKKVEDIINEIDR